MSGADGFVPPGELGEGTDEAGLLSRLFEMSPDLLCVAGTDGYFKRINPAFDRLGYTREHLLSTPFLHFVHPDDRMATLEEVAKLANGVPTVHFRNRYRRHDGTYVRVAWMATPDGQGRIYATARLSDLDDGAERGACQGFEALALAVAEDLRAPLRAVEGFGRALWEDCAHLLDDEGRMYLERLRRNARAMGKLIDNLRALAELPRGSDDGRVDLSQAARELEKRAREAEPGREIRVDVAEGLSVRGDRRLVLAVLEALFDNAWKFTRDKEGARIEVGRDEALACVHVRDNGAGFDSAMLPRLFRVGEGVSLAIAKRIMDRLGGRIWAEGRPGEGAIFRFALPEPAERSE